MSVESKTPVTHVIFDLGGTIVNTIDVILNIFQNFENRYGKELTQEFKNNVSDAKSDKECLGEAYDLMGLKNHISFDEFIQTVSKMFYESDYKLIPGVDRLIKHLHKSNISMAIASNGRKSHLNLLKAKFGNYFDVGNYFSHIVFGGDDEEVVNNKPNPDIYFVCAKRFQLQPKDYKNILIIEDSLTGIEGAVASDMQTVWLKDSNFYDKCYPIEDKVSYIISSYYDFKPEIFGISQFDS